MRIIVDAENMANARTGIPKVSFLDSMALFGLFAQVELHVSKSALKALVESAEYARLRDQDFKGNSSKLRINSDRSSNLKIWVSQIYSQGRISNLDDFDFSYTSLFPGLYNSGKRCRNIIRLHDPFRSKIRLWEEARDANSLRNTIARVLRDQSFRSQLRNHSIVVANSFWTRRRCSEFYGVEEDSIDVIWPSVGFRGEQSERRNSSHVANPYLICVMSQRQRKKPIFAINAWAKVASKVNLRLYVVGDIKHGDLSTLALKKIELGELVIHKYLTEEALKKLQINAYASIFASTGEGFGLPIAESLFYGVPVLHNNLEVFREVSDGLGLEFSLDSEDSLIEKIEGLVMSEEKRQKLVALSLERGTFFSHEYSTSRWEKLLLNENFRGNEESR